MLSSDAYSAIQSPMATLRVNCARPFASVRPTSRRAMATVRAAVATEEYLPNEKANIRMDASKNGCTGMFWRTKPEMNSTVTASDWPRNGTVFKGWKSIKHPGWVKVDHPQGYWLPIQQYGNDVLHFDK